MKFIDEVQISVQGGDGGRGCVSFLREKFRPRGGPDGGDGGDGGNVILRTESRITTLVEFVYRPHLRAESGEHGRGKKQHGRKGRDLIVGVPPGTIVRNATTGEVLADLGENAEEVVVTRGGKGGRGNAAFVSSTNRAPRRAQPGQRGEARILSLELRLLADVGLVGLANVGKSTLLAAVSSARPRIADYPFSTLAPQLGVVRCEEEGSFVMADMPGLIEGAHRGEGLGLRFLRHIARTAILVHLLDISRPERDPLQDYDIINRELAHFDPALSHKPQIVAVNKMDLPEARQRLASVREAFSRRGIEVHAISAVTGEGLRTLISRIAREIEIRRISPAASASYGAAEP